MKDCEARMVALEAFVSVMMLSYQYSRLHITSCKFMFYYGLALMDCFVALGVHFWVPKWAGGLENGPVHFKIG